MLLSDREVIIHDGNAQQFLSPVVNGEQKFHGLNPRNFALNPIGGMRGVPVSTVAKIPRSEWPERIKDQIASQSRLSDVRNHGKNGERIPSRDQNGRGYCWSHSTVTAAMLSRAKDGQAYADLSAYAIACIIKNYRDEGGWNGESMDFLRERGCPTSEFWAQQSVSKSNDNAATWENAALHKMTEWEDIPEGDFDTQGTYSLLGIPYALDLNWWSHSICGCDLVDGAAMWNAGQLRDISGKLLPVKEFEVMFSVNDFGAAFGARIFNSWGDSWSDNGMGILTESKARNNGAIALRTTTPSIN